MRELRPPVSAEGLARSQRAAGLAGVRAVGGEGAGWGRGGGGGGAGAAEVPQPEGAGLTAGASRFPLGHRVHPTEGAERGRAEEHARAPSIRLMLRSPVKSPPR